MKADFCWNSKRWIVFMLGRNIGTCPYPPTGSCCDECGYYEMREVTNWFKRKYRLICEACEDL